MYLQLDGHDFTVKIFQILGFTIMVINYPRSGNELPITIWNLYFYWLISVIFIWWFLCESNKIIIRKLDYGWSFPKLILTGLRGTIKIPLKAFFMIFRFEQTTINMKRAAAMKKFISLTLFFFSMLIIKSLYAGSIVSVTGEGPNLKPRITQDQVVNWPLPKIQNNGVRIFSTPFNWTEPPLLR